MARTIFDRRHPENQERNLESQGRSGRHAAGARGRAGRAAKPRKRNFISRAINNWWSRLLEAVAERSLNQEEEYEAGRGGRDYLWNAIGTGTWGMVFPILTIVATQLVGVEQAGMFSMAFVTGLLLMFVANYGVRTYQVSDLNEQHSFTDYQINRWLTCALMVVIGIVYCSIRGYDNNMFLISMGVYFYKMIDGLADVYEGRLQQMDKLYLAGISQAFRSVAVLVAFALCLLVTRNLAVASIAMAVVSLASFIVLTLPLALFETPRSRRWRAGSVAQLFKQCFPLFIALFMYNLIDNMPKFVMEGVLSYDNQLYFNALYFPAHALLLSVQLIYKPQLVRMASVWANVSKRKRFDIIIVAMMGVIVALTLGLMALMGWIGIPIMGFLYGIDFEEFRGLAFIMIAAGGVTAGIDFLYQVVTILRKQGSVTKLYLITFGFSLFIPILLVSFTELPGAVIGYLIVMSILFVLLIWEYIRIRTAFSREDAARAASEESESGAGAHRRPSEIRAERRHRAEVMSRRTGRHAKSDAKPDE